ncbi:hypothetical protein [Mesorhizobium sp. KR9-304]|uniref:hypothetical protein n=1 Tax=Mesorhizobium sp. KR9-304 TaxID=3156614 RepID=UPI0032B60E32
MSERNGARALLVAPLLVSGLLVSGCMSSPTYGTGTTQTKQLTTDVSTMFSLKPKRANAEYAPRPELVKPTTPTTELPPPQENIVASAGDQWPESPEQRRARIRADATENRDKQGWEPEVINDLSLEQETQSAAVGTSDRATESGVAAAGKAEDLNKKGAEARQRLAASKQGSPTVRRTLTEPPIEYRQPIPTAPADELGEDEYKKQRRLKAEARKAAGDTSWRDLIPWL